MPSLDPSRPGPAARHAHGGVRHVLVVDDDDLLREVAKAALELVGGWRVTAVLSGAEAQERAVSVEPDAILLDVMMPGLNGPDTVQALRRDPRTADIPVIFLTAKLPSADRDAWAGLGLAGVIPKPFDPMSLAAEMSRMLGWTE